MVDLSSGFWDPGSSDDDADDDVVRPPPKVLEAARRLNADARQDPPRVRVEDDDEKDSIPEIDEIDLHRDDPDPGPSVQRLPGTSRPCPRSKKGPDYVHELSDDSSNKKKEEEESIPMKLLATVARNRELMSFVCKEDGRIMVPLVSRDDVTEHLDAATVKCERKTAEADRKRKQREEVERKRKQKEEADRKRRDEADRKRKDEADRRRKQLAASRRWKEPPKQRAMETPVKNAKKPVPPSAEKPKPKPPRPPLPTHTSTGELIPPIRFRIVPFPHPKLPPLRLNTPWVNDEHVGTAKYKEVDPYLREAMQPRDKKEMREYWEKHLDGLNWKEPFSMKMFDKYYGSKETPAAKSSDRPRYNPSCKPPFKPVSREDAPKSVEHKMFDLLTVLRKLPNEKQFQEDEEDEEETDDDDGSFVDVSDISAESEILSSSVLAAASSSIRANNNLELAEYFPNPKITSTPKRDGSD